MKFMKIGTKLDSFYQDEATRTVVSDIPSDLVIKVNNISYFLHKFPLLPCCGLLHRLCADANDSSVVTIELHNIPGSSEAFELCAKFCYGITINLSAHNFVPAFCAAKFLQMNETVEKGNFELKLEAFFNSCILQGWKDSIVTLKTTAKVIEWSENHGIIRRCIDSIVEKVLTPPSKVSWSYTYTRQGFSKHQQPVPRDWWTEDISDLDIHLFRYVITAIRSTSMLLPQLIGEALHVYALRWLPDTRKIRSLAESSASQTDETIQEHKQILETIAGMIPVDRGSVSVGFLFRLLSVGNFLGASSLIKTELTRKACLQLEEATVNDLLFPSHSSSDQHFYDIELVLAVLDSFLAQWRQQSPAPKANNQLTKSITKVAKLIDSYLQVIARDKNVPVSKLETLAEALPDIARKSHDDLYKAINIYLEKHPDMSKADKRSVCKILDCQKLSPEVRAHAVKNERLPLRTIVQILFFEQEKGSRPPENKMPLQEKSPRRQHTPFPEDDLAKLELGPNEKSRGLEGNRETSAIRSSIVIGEQRREKPDKKVIREEIEEVGSEKGREFREQQNSRAKVDTSNDHTKGNC